MCWSPHVHLMVLLNYNARHHCSILETTHLASFQVFAVVQLRFCFSGMTVHHGHFNLEDALIQCHIPEKWNPEPTFIQVKFWVETTPHFFKNMTAYLQQISGGRNDGIYTKELSQFIYSQFIHSVRGCTNITMFKIHKLQFYMNCFLDNESCMGRMGKGYPLTHLTNKSSAANCPTLGPI